MNNYFSFLLDVILKIAGQYIWGSVVLDVLTMIHWVMVGGGGGAEQ